MLLNEFLKAHRQIQMQQRQIDVLVARVQQLSAHVEVIEAAMRVAATEP
jgi:hypothetical protein